MVNLNVAAVDLLCGISGLTHGLVKVGIPVVAGIDIDGTCKYAFEANNDSDFIHANITDPTSKEVSDLCPEDCTKILGGYAPCQPFSPHTQENKKQIEDEKWKLS